MDFVEGVVETLVISRQFPSPSAGPLPTTGQQRFGDFDYFLFSVRGHVVLGLDAEFYCQYFMFQFLFPNCRSLLLSYIVVATVLLQELFSLV